MTILQRLLKTAVFWSIVVTALRLLGLVIVLPMMLSHLDPDKMGLWYLFLSFGSFALLMDAGIGISATRAVAYLWGGAPDFLDEGLAQKTSSTTGQINHKLFADLFASLRVVYLVVAVCVIVLLGAIGGIWIWEKSTSFTDALSVRLAWLFYILGVAYSCYAAVWYILLQGVNGVRQAQQAYVLAIVANYGATIVGLKLGIGIWAPVIGNFLQGIITRWGHWTKFQEIADPTIENLKSGKASWPLIKKLWPQAWRGAATSLGVYLTLSSGTLISSWVGGLAQTASYGLSFQLSVAIVQIASVPFLVKVPLLTQLRARNDIGSIRKILVQRLSLFWLGCLAGGGCFILLGDWALRNFARSSTELLPKHLLGAVFLFVALEGNQGIFRDLYLTTNRNPFVIPILVTGLLILVSSFYLGSIWGIAGIIAGQLLSQLIWNNWSIPLKGLQSIAIAR